jgi:hypothetical protein
LVDVAVSGAQRQSLVLRFADVGVATYASLRVVGAPSQTVTWVVEVPTVVAALENLTAALPDPQGSETQRDAVERAIAAGPFASPPAESVIARDLGARLLAPRAWQLLTECTASPRAALFISPSARLARVPWAALAMPGDDGFRLIELVDVLMAAPPNIVNAPRTPVDWGGRQGSRPLLILDPRVPGQRPDSPLGSVLGKPSPAAPRARYLGDLVARRPVLPGVTTPVELFQRTDAGRAWLAAMLAQARRRPVRGARDRVDTGVVAGEGLTRQCHRHVLPRRRRVRDRRVRCAQLMFQRAPSTANVTSAAPAAKAC